MVNHQGLVSMKTFRNFVEVGMYVYVYVCVCVVWVEWVCLWGV